MEFLENLTYIKAVGYILFAYLSIGGLIFFFDEKNFNKMFLIAVITSIIGLFINEAISEIISNEVFNGKYENIIFTIFFIIVFIIAHIIAIKKDWKFSKHID